MTGSEKTTSTQGAPTTAGRSSGTANAEPLLRSETQNVAPNGAHKAKQVPDAGTLTESFPEAINSSSASSAAAVAAAGTCRKNVRAMFVLQIVMAVALGTAMGPVFDRYLFYLGSGWARGPRLFPAHATNSLVGMAESISGLSSLFLAIPVGLLVDKNPQRRARLLQWSTVFGLASAVIAVVGVLTDYLLLIYLALVLQGAFWELSNSASEAIFADSIPQGERSGIFTTKAILGTVGMACGPLLSAIGLLYLGDEWEPYQMRAVIVAGTCLLPISCAVMFLFADPPANQAEGDSTATPSSTDSLASVSTRCSSSEEVTESPAEETQIAARRWGPFHSHHVPVLLAISDFVTAIGAGMTVKFFNLFFIRDQHFSPVSICALTTAYPLVIALFMKFTQWMSKPFGRAQASLFFFSSNVVCLFLMSQVHNLPFLLTVFLLRGGFANASYPIDRSILMDFTPSSQRGRWNTVESFTSMTWSGSAFIGGLLSDSHDYRYTFLITAVVYATACLLYAPLLALVPQKERQAASLRTGLTQAREVNLTNSDDRAGA